MSSGLVLFDVDGTVSDGMPDPEARPGIYEMLEVLHALGYEIRLWSAAGKGHARQVAEALRLPFIAGHHDKPPRWRDAAAYCQEQMGQPPALIVDDTDVGPLPGVAVLRVRHALEVMLEALHGQRKVEA